MASQESDWNVKVSKKNKKKNNKEEKSAALKQQYADYLHTKQDGLETDLSDFDEYEHVPETPSETVVAQAEAQNLEGETSNCGKRVVEELPEYQAWFKRVTQFDSDLRYQKEDLNLIQYHMSKSDLLILDEPDVTPVPHGWGSCLMGRFAGRFPGKEAIYDLMRRWKQKSRVTFHRKGWLVFQFGSEEAMEKVRQLGPFDIFGIPLVLQPMPKKFDPDMEPEVMVPLWLRLVDLPLELWNLTAVSKIASCFGTPLSTDFSTLRRESLDGPRIQVIIDTAKRPKESLTIQLPNGDFVEQKVEYEFIPKFCNSCKTYGHYADECQGRKEEWNQVHRIGPVQRRRERSVPRHQGKQQLKPFPRTQHPEVNRPNPTAQGTGLVGQVGPRERSRSRSRPQKQWKPTGVVYPVEVKYTRPEDPIIQQIPTSPNKFAPLAGEARPGPSDTLEAPTVDLGNLPKDLLAAVLPQILAAIPGNVPLPEPTPFVNAERRHRSRSRDPRIHRETDKGAENGVGVVPVDDSGKDPVIQVVDGGTPVKQQALEATSGKEEAAKKKSKKQQNGASAAQPPTVVAREAPHDQVSETVGHVQATNDAPETDQCATVTGTRRGRTDTRQSQSEVAGEPGSTRKSKSRSRSRKRDVTPPHWEDGLEADPGVSQ